MEMKSIVPLELGDSTPALEREKRLLFSHILFPEDAETTNGIHGSLGTPLKFKRQRKEHRNTANSSVSKYSQVVVAVQRWGRAAKD